MATPSFTHLSDEHVGCFQGVPPRSWHGLGFFNGPRAPGKAGQRAQWLNGAEAEGEGYQGAGSELGRSQPSLPKARDERQLLRLVAGAPKWAAGVGASQPRVGAEGLRHLHGLASRGARGRGHRCLGVPSEPVYLTST